MNRPEPGFAVPISFLRARDADTIEVRPIYTALTIAVRLIDVWAPELHRGNQQELASQGRRWVSDYMNQADPESLLLHIPFHKGDNPLKFLSFDRIPGYVWNGDVLVNELVVVNGFASSKKNGELGR